MKKSWMIAALAATGLTLAATSAGAMPQSAELSAEAYDAAQADYEAQVDVYMRALQTWQTGQLAYQQWNMQQRGWTTTQNGLQYRRIGKANPSGAQPSGSDTVSVHYRGRFIDGREFDSSHSRNEPTSFPLDRVIKGWTEGVALMREGETYEFVIPADLAYGNRWIGGNLIPPGSTLLFTVELLKVNP